MNIEFENMDAFCDQILGELTIIADDWRSVFARWGMKLTLAAAEASPQWTGNFASNWTLGIDDPDPSYVPRFGKPAHTRGNLKVKWMGDAEAIDVVRASQAGKLERVRLDSVLFIGNATPYGDYIAENRAEDGKPFLRAGNYRDPLPIPLGYAELQADRLFAEAQ